MSSHSSHCGWFDIFLQKDGIIWKQTNNFFPSCICFIYFPCLTTLSRIQCNVDLSVEGGHPCPVADLIWEVVLSPSLSSMVVVAHLPQMHSCLTRDCADPFWPKLLSFFTLLLRAPLLASVEWRVLKQIAIDNPASVLTSCLTDLRKEPEELHGFAQVSLDIHSV